MIRTPAGLIVRALLAALFFTGAFAVVGVVVPAGAGAFASIEGPPVFSSAPGLPDGRVYELVSPANKNGNEAGATSLGTVETGPKQHYGYASPDGDSVLFEGTGPMGESPSPDSNVFVARRSTGGWSTRALEPAAQHGGRSVPLDARATYVDPAPDLSHAMVVAGGWTLGSEPNGCGAVQLWLTGPDPFVGALWLERPRIEDPVEHCGIGNGFSGAPVGGSPDFSTVYFAYPGTLLPEDAARAPHVPVGGSGGVEPADGAEAWGFYEESEGVLREAGVLPDGGLDQFGAVPAASGHGRALAGNEVSTDGSRAFFVSPDPGSCEQNGTSSGA